MSRVSPALWDRCVPKKRPKYSARGIATESKRTRDQKRAMYHLRVCNVYSRSGSSFFAYGEFDEGYLELRGNSVDTDPAAVVGVVAMEVVERGYVRYICRHSTHDDGKPGQN